MAERKAVNKYYPPDWDPRKGSVNKRVGQHPLRDRAKKISQGILVIRFELPYNIWCGGCGSHVGMGVRYNAEKSKVGNYYSTPIYKFRMKCHLCDNYFEIQTDPQNHDYVILCGARRKEQRWDPAANGQIVPEDKATQKKLATDAMYKLEHGSDDARKGKDKVMDLAEIEDSRMSMKDDYILNRMARDKFRTEKKHLKELAEADEALLQKSSLDIDLLEETEEDKKLAGLMKYSVTTSYEDKQKEIRKNIELRPIFDSGGHLQKPSLVSSSSSSKVLLDKKHNRPISGRRGELKQKLGLALKASHGDPFKEKKSLISTKTNAASVLGIKVKSPLQSTKNSTPFFRACKTDLNPVTQGKEENKCSIDLAISESDNREALNGKNRLRDDSDGSVSQDASQQKEKDVSSSHLPPCNSLKSVSDKSSSPVSPITPSPFSVSENQANEDSPIRGTRLSRCDSNLEQPCGDSSTISTADVNASGDQQHEPPSSALNTLMTSYTDSDSSCND